MKLSEQQWLFTQDVSKLIIFASENGFKLTFGEAYRPEIMQIIYHDGWHYDKDEKLWIQDSKYIKSKTMKSLHLDRLAVDFNIFKDVDGDGHKELTWDIDIIKPLGNYWESLSDLNVWGGNWRKFPDAPHFQRNLI